jgi:hypothetical protein
MPTFRVTSGALTLDSVGGNYPSNELPGDQPGIDNSLPIPPPPPGIWPPPVPAHPIVPIPPGGSTPPPGTIWPSPGHPAHPIAPGGSPRPDQTLPPTGMDPHPSHPIASGTYWCLVYLPGFGWKYVVIDPSLHVDVSPPAPQPAPTPHK